MKLDFPAEPIAPAEPAAPSARADSRARAVSPKPATAAATPRDSFSLRLQRLEARAARFLGGDLRPGRFVLALFFAAMAAQAAFAARANRAGSPGDWMAQALSIASVGRLSFAAAPHLVALIELGCALAIALRPSARLSFCWLLGRLILGAAPLLMLRDDLWRRFPLAPSIPGWGVALSLLPVGWALSVCVQSRWKWLESAPQTAPLLRETPAQKRARIRAWQRNLAVGVALLLLGFAAFRAFWPRYLGWFHARQERAALNEVLAGRLIKKSLPFSPLLHRKITVWVYLPPGYAHSAARYPVIYLLHGMPGEVRDCFVKGQVQLTADHLILSHQVRPFILVGWDAQGPGGPGDVTNFLDRPGYPMESFITRELVPDIDRQYRTIARPQARALDGISAGGYGAANLLLKYPGIWKIAASHNGFFSPEDDAENMTQILGSSRAKWAANDPTRLLHARSKADDLHFYGDIGAGDDLQDEFVGFGKKLSARGIPNEMHVFPGRHTWEFWSEHFGDSFRFENHWFGALAAASASRPIR